MEDKNYSLLVCAFSPQDIKTSDPDDVMARLGKPGVMRDFYTAMDHHAAVYDLRVTNYADDAVLMEGDEKGMLALIGEIDAKHVMHLVPKEEMAAFADYHVQERRKVSCGGPSGRLH